MTARFDYSVAMNFSWLDEGRIAGCRGPRGDNDLAFLTSVGIQALVRLAHEDETGISSADIESNGMEECYEPVPDWTAPSQHQIDRIIGFVHNAIQRGRSVAVSCGAGYGRTGTVLACYLISAGHSAEHAIQQLLAVRPCSREILIVPGQKEAVMEFARRLGREAVNLESEAQDRRSQAADNERNPRQPNHSMHRIANKSGSR